LLAGEETKKLSLPGLTRQSIRFEKILLRRLMDTRVKPAYDDCACGASPPNDYVLL